MLGHGFNPITSTNLLKLSIMVKKAKSFKDYLAKIEDPKYQGGSWDLPENASPLEKSKYDLCENILSYK